MNDEQRQPRPARNKASYPVAYTAETWLLDAMRRQRQKGLGEYGQELTTWNGRNASGDAMEELADTANYLTQMHMEREDAVSFICLIARDAFTDPVEVARKWLTDRGIKP